jgi:aminopeptidase N
VFRSIVYNKAAMVLHMLRRIIGDEAFFRGVRDFYAEWKYRKAGSDDLLAAMEKAGGRDLSRFFDAWVFGAGIPQAKFSYRVEGSRAIFRIDQSGLPIEFPVSIKLTYRSGEEQTLVMIARDKVTEQTLELAGVLRSAKANEDHGTLAEIR